MRFFRSSGDGNAYARAVIVPDGKAALGQGLWMNSVVRTCVYALVLLCWLYPACAQDTKDWRDKAQKLYSQQEGVVKEALEAKVQKPIEAREHHNQRKLTREEIAEITWLAALVEYQLLIDRMVCTEQLLNGESRPAIKLETINSCVDERSTASQEMFRLIKEYGLFSSFDLNMCLTKTRLFKFEIRYPPYEFMKQDNKPSPGAQDAAIFLECFKSRP
jgi:hypothetical protein